MADQVAGEIRSALHGSASSAAVPGSAAAALAKPAPDTVAAADVEALLAALGGRANVRAVEAAASRLRGERERCRTHRPRCHSRLGLRGTAIPVAGCVHVIVGPAANAVCAALRRLLG